MKIVVFRKNQSYIYSKMTKDNDCESVICAKGLEALAMITAQIENLAETVGDDPTMLAELILQHEKEKTAESGNSWRSDK